MKIAKIVYRDSIKPRLATGPRPHAQTYVCISYFYGRSDNYGGVSIACAQILDGILFPLHTCKKWMAP